MTKSLLEVQIKLNNSILRQITKVLDENPTADLETTLQKLTATYPVLRNKVTARHSQPSSLNRPCQEPSSLPTKARSTPRLPPRPPIPPEPLLDIISPLSSPLRLIFPESSNLSTSNFTSVLRNAILSAPIISHVTSSLLARILNLEEGATLQHVQTHFPGLPVPEHYGTVQLGPAHILFLSRLPGSTIESRIQSDLDKIISRLHTQQELLPSLPLFGSVQEHICRDTRMRTRTSCPDDPIKTQEQFNDFLMSGIDMRMSKGYRTWLRSLLRDDHPVVFSHGDLHPGNILVQEQENGEIEISGILDWEMAGYYPAYWDALKARNTRDTKDSSDWWEHLPPTLEKYGVEIAVDRLIERAMR
ncbi:kinase-like protein [Flagelloscypha sp. PMI_526]|nr:kinase-like protein [Flagelloscypha sp. PMI_526]